MPIIQDTDLLRIEPSVFTDAGGAALLLVVSDDAVIEGTVLTRAKSTFDAGLVEAGGVIVVDGQPLEIVELLTATSLEVTRPRLPDGELIAPGDGEALIYSVLSFGLIIEQSELWLERTLGLDPLHPQVPLTSDNVLNLDDFAPLVAYRVIAHAFAVAAAADPEDASLQSRADLYERMCHDLRQQMIADIDVDGDGVVDERRRLAVGTWTRV